MKIAAIICEFNPLHTGHKHLLAFAQNNADKVVCIMSGNFTQRGMPACADKYSRARHAILAGADMVIELPTIFATASAENFALGGIYMTKILNADFVVFGSECGDIARLRQCADTIDLPEIQQKIKNELKKGVTYPKAIALATGLAELDKPNNTLAIEYIRALHKLNCNASPLTIKREDNYNSSLPHAYASSALLRADPNLRQQYTFNYVTQDIIDNVEQKYCDFVPLYMSLISPEELQPIEGVTEGLENRIADAEKMLGYEHFIEQIKTKRYTRLKLQRIILNAILRITKENVEESKNAPIPIKILAVRKSATTLLPDQIAIEDKITERADKLYAALTGKSVPTKLQVIDC